MAPIFMKAPTRSSTESVHARARVYQSIYGNEAPVDPIARLLSAQTFKVRRNNAYGLGRRGRYRFKLRNASPRAICDAESTQESACFGFSALQTQLCTSEGTNAEESST